MEWTRARDWLIGAVAMLVLLVVAVVILWWVVSEPAGEVEAGPAPSWTADGAPAAEPPADLREDEVWLDDLDFDAGTVVTAGSTLRDVRAVGQDVVSGPDGLVAARLNVDATVPFDAVARELGGGSEVRPGDDGQATVVRTVDVLGRGVRVTATGTVDVEDGRLVMEPTSIDLGGPGLLSGATAAVVRGLVTIEHDIEGLPEGLVLQDVTVQGNGFRANLRGEDVRLGS
ncbi:LmeA family phospholipid-binding protein [Arthrobacter sp. MDT2-16]